MDKKTKNIIFRASEDELKLLKTKAQLLTGGNISEFIRDAILNYNPKKGVKMVENDSKQSGEN